MPFPSCQCVGQGKVSVYGYVRTGLGLLEREQVLVLLELEQVLFQEWQNIHRACLAPLVCSCVVEWMS